MLLLLALLPLSMSPCSLSPNAYLPTIDDQILYASVIIIGRVRKVEGPNVIELEDTEYYKGCGPKKPLIDGFTSSAACGIDVPPPGEKVIIFGCNLSGDFFQKRVTINSIGPFTGAVSANNPEIVNKIRQTLKKKWCLGFHNMEKCKNPTTNNDQDIGRKILSTIGLK